MSFIGAGVDPPPGSSEIDSPSNVLDLNRIVSDFCLKLKENSESLYKNIFGKHFHESSGHLLNLNEKKSLISSVSDSSPTISEKSKRISSPFYPQNPLIIDGPKTFKLNVFDFISPWTFVYAAFTFWYFAIHLFHGLVLDRNSFLNPS